MKSKRGKEPGRMSLSVLSSIRKEIHFISEFSRNNCKFGSERNALTNDRFKNNSIMVT